MHFRVWDLGHRGEGLVGLARGSREGTRLSVARVKGMFAAEHLEERAFVRKVVLSLTMAVFDPQ